MLNFTKASELLDKSGRTKKWLADQCGIEVPTLGYYLRGDRKPRLPVLKLMAQALGVEVSDLESPIVEANTARRVSK